MGAKFRRQHPIGRYIADFYCQEARLVVELDGGVHSTECQQEYDDARQSAIEATGITVLRINNQEVEDDLEKVLEKISARLS
jgi:very-short-patch-repair endonuclease